MTQNTNPRRPGRAERRRILLELRRRGCDCSPIVLPHPTVPGAGDVWHEEHCTFGSRIAELNNRGYLPAVGVPWPSRCAR